MADEENILNALESLKSRVRSRPVQDRQIEIEEDHTKEFTQAMKALGDWEVLVGFPAEKDEPRTEGSRINNATLGYIHEFGSPINNIPARPFLRPGVRNSASKWQPKLADAATAALGGDSGTMMKKLDEAGVIASNEVKRTILAGIPPPVKRRRSRGTGSGYRRKAETPADTIALVDTGQMLRSITWVVVKK